MLETNPFGRETRLRVLGEYFASAGAVTAENAWEHVYKCLLWMNEGAGLAHIYDSNHMQPGGNFHGRAVRFTESLCEKWDIQKTTLPRVIDKLFKGCVHAWRETVVERPDPELENELTAAIDKMLRGLGVDAARAAPAARRIEALSRDFFTVGNKRKNSLGEGFEDLLWLLLQRVSNVPPEKLSLRTPVSRLPGFRRGAQPLPGQRRRREPHPDIAICDNGVTHLIVTAKWSMRQDRETQFQSEYSAYQRNRVQPTELQFALITNEFDIARLDNVARAIPTGAGGYIFHNIYHINPELLKIAQGDRIGSVAHWIGAGKIRSLADFFNEMRGLYGVP